MDLKRFDYWKWHFWVKIYWHFWTLVELVIAPSITRWKWLDCLGFYAYYSYVYLSYYTDDFTWRKLDVDWGVASVTSGGSCLLSSIRCLLIGSYHKGGTQKRCGIVTYLARVFNATYVHVKLSHISSAFTSNFGHCARSPNSALGPLTQAYA